MRWLLIMLVSSVALAGKPGRFDRFNLDNRRTTRGLEQSSYAFFEAFPLSGAGAGTACACAAVTGAKGEALTFTRASNGTCTKGNPTTGIANGDLVVCSTNQPRVGNPDGLGLALLVESSRANSAIKSQQLDDVAWVTQNTGAGTTTVTADQAVAPDGTTTAERLQIAASGAAEQHILYQLSTCGAATACSVSVFVKGNGTSGTVDLCTGSNHCSACAYVSTSWTRCTSSVASLSLNSYIGNDTINNGGTTRPAADIFAWGFQAEQSASYATSYVPTTTVAVTRAGEAPSFTLSPGVGPNGCMAGTAIKTFTQDVSADLFSLGVAGAGNNWAFYRTASPGPGFQIGATITSSVVAIDTAAHRWLISDNAGTRTAYFDGVSKTPPAASMSGAQTSLTFAALVGAGGQSSTYYRGIQIDPSPTRCSP